MPERPTPERLGGCDDALCGSGRPGTPGHVRILTPSEFRSQPWKNGGGVTHEIVRWPDTKGGGDAADAAKAGDAGDA